MRARTPRSGCTTAPRHAAGPLKLRCGALTAPGGEVLEARVDFDPAEVSPLPPRSSRGVTVSVAIGGEPRPGIYRGTIQADGAPPLWLPVEVAVEPCRALPPAELVEAYSEDVSRLVRRSMLDAIPDGEPHRWLYRVARVYPSRPGKALRPALSRGHLPRLRRPGQGHPAGRRRDRAAPQRLPRPRRHRRRQRASPRAPHAAGRVRRSVWRSTPATRWRSSRIRCCDATPPAWSRAGRPRAARVRRDGAAHARGAGDRARLAARRRRRPDARRTTSS